ncbi:putative uncharacterized protein DDB_G0283051 [Sycon ciliatum]|uniref:putative uncharacterized protein DDB_G0283051 n=1 Tax=Sycon ciliatum TaxID=27933 RepID=UPI0031F6E8A9
MCDGMIERDNRTIQVMLRAFIDSADCDSWDERLPLAQLAYNTRPSPCNSNDPLLHRLIRNDITTSNTTSNTTNITPDNTTNITPDITTNQIFNNTFNNKSNINCNHNTLPSTQHHHAH